MKLSKIMILFLIFNLVEKAFGAEESPPRRDPEGRLLLLQVLANKSLRSQHKEALETYLATEGSSLERLVDGKNLLHFCARHHLRATCQQILDRQPELIEVEKLIPIISALDGI